MDTLLILDVYEKLFEHNTTEFSNTEFNNTEFNNLQDYASIMGHQYLPSKKKNSYCTQTKEYIDTLLILDVNRVFFESNNTDTVFDSLQNQTTIIGHQHLLSNNIFYNNENSYYAQVKEYMDTLPILDVDKNFVEINNTEFNKLQDHTGIIDYQYLLPNDNEKNLATTEDIEAQEENNRIYTYFITLEMNFMNWADLD
ncbi:23836_t:CDS:2, partial [Dentiscutata erythropus]